MFGRKTSQDLPGKLQFQDDIFTALSAADLSDEEKKVLEERKLARAQKNFKRSDELRDLLKQKGIAVEDGREGQTWRRL